MRLNRSSIKVGTAAAATTVLATAGLVAMAAPANAALTTNCVGEAGAVTVPGNLVVPANQSCTLDGTTVNGNVTVRSGGDLIITDGSIGGNVVVAEDAYFDASGTEVEGNVTARSAFGAYLEDSSVAANLRANAVEGNDTEGFIFAIGTDVEGNLVSQTGDLYAESSVVAGNVNATGVAYADLFDTAVDGNLRIDGAEFGSVIVGSEVHGNAVITNNSGQLYIGLESPGVAGAVNYFGGNLTLTNNTADLQIDNTIVRGNVRATGNDPVAQTGENNRFRGNVTGDFDEIPASMARAFSVEADRKADAEAQVEERRADAEAAAAKAGAAKL